MVEPELLDKILLYSGIALGVITSIGIVVTTLYNIYRAVLKRKWLREINAER